MNSSILNTAGYKFIGLDNLEDLKIKFKEKALALKLKGTILLSEEGVNIFLAGLEKDVNDFRAYLSTYPLLKDIYWKDSYSEKKPFRRLLVKIKQEIISMNHRFICTPERKAKAVTPKELKKWLDNNEEVLLLDTRNDYEIRLGAFKKASDLHLDHFREFPEKIKSLLPNYQDKKIVAYCTGGIRGEKAALFMEELGFKDVYQLEGGILEYFKQCENAHYEGDCFVFDYRVALDKNLQETETTMCFACLEPLTLEEQKNPAYQIGKQCPYCAPKLSTKTVEEQAEMQQ